MLTAAAFLVFLLLLLVAVVVLVAIAVWVALGWLAGVLLVGGVAAALSGD